MKRFVPAVIFGSALLAVATAGLLRTRVAAQAKPESAQPAAITIE